MGLTDAQRRERIKEKGAPLTRLEFDVFADGSVSMWTHFDHGDDFQRVRADLLAIKTHLEEFLRDEAMCPFHGIARDQQQ
jgi:hypothetical protein